MVNGDLGILNGELAATCLCCLDTGISDAAEFAVFAEQVVQTGVQKHLAEADDF
jgi:hypothetical protein